MQKVMPVIFLLFALNTIYSSTQLSNYPLPKDFGGGYCFGVVRPTEAFPAVRPAFLSRRTRFRCTAPTGNRVMALCYFQIYRMHFLVIDFQILLSPAEDFEGDIILALSVRPSSFRPAMDYGKLTIVKSLASYH